MGIFDLEGPVMRFLGRMADIMWLNVLTLICCLPIITAGASITAMHYVSLKMVRNEEGYITKDFFKSFKMNFRQSTILWLIILVLGFIIAGDYYIMSRGDVEISKFVKMAILAVTILIVFTAVMVFPLLARFTNSVRNTIKNAFAVGMLQFPKTLLMIVLWVVPFFAVAYWRVLPLVVFFGLSLPAYFSAMLYNKTFKMLEDRFLSSTEGEGGEAGDETESGEEERIFKDELDESLQDDRNAPYGTAQKTTADHTEVVDIDK